MAEKLHCDRCDDVIAKLEMHVIVAVQVVSAEIRKTAPTQTYCRPCARYQGQNIIDGLISRALY